MEAFSGLEGTAEGPLNKKNNGSFLIAISLIIYKVKNQVLKRSRKKFLIVPFSNQF
tara:strand:+ start:1510 stop:1677 length:168 start_codon:yes stop_codon:yes gene_type:complete